MRLRVLLCFILGCLLAACSDQEVSVQTEPVDSAQQAMVNPSDPLVVAIDPTVSVAPGRRVANPSQPQFYARLGIVAQAHLIETMTFGLSAGSPADVSTVKLVDATDLTVWVSTSTDVNGFASPDLASMDSPFIGPPYSLDLFVASPALNAPSAVNLPRAGDQVAMTVVDITDDEQMGGDLQGLGPIGPYTLHPVVMGIAVPGTPVSPLVNGVNSVTFMIDCSGAPGGATRQLVFGLVASGGVSVNMSGVTYPFTFNGVSIGASTSGAALFSAFGATNRTGLAFVNDRLANGPTSIPVTVRFNASGIVSGSTVTVTPLYDSRLGAFKLTSFNPANGGITATPVAGGAVATWSSLWTDSSESLPGGPGHKSSLPTSGDYYSFEGMGDVASITLVAP